MSKRQFTTFTAWWHYIVHWAIFETDTCTTEHLDRSREFKARYDRLKNSQTPTK
jgi:hypothetical protein